MIQIKFNIFEILGALMFVTFLLGVQVVFGWL